MTINITDFNISYWNSIIRVELDREEKLTTHSFKLKDETLKQIKALIEPDVKAKIRELAAEIDKKEE